MANKDNKIKLYWIVIPAVAILTAFIGSQLTSIGLKDWYFVINKPSWTPPGYVIGLVWTTIYILASISAFIVFSKQGANLKRIALLFLLNAFLNALWSALFFVFHTLDFAIVEAVALGLSVLALIINIWPISKVASYLLFPYLGWVTFATYLTYLVSSLNR
jgi:benzodiazapine receptor